MRNPAHCLCLLLSAALLPCVRAQDEISAVYTDPALDLSKPGDRDRAMARIEEIENTRLRNARAKARALGLPVRVDIPRGATRELIAFDSEGPVYLTTKNANAAISTAANQLWSSPYMLDGSGLGVGVWDAGNGRASHQEFIAGSRLVNMDGSTMHYHSMHVAGTIAAFGVDAAAHGMANAARINSYNWINDLSEMGGAGATAPGQTATRIYLSNHSYGTGDGWVWNGANYQWTGTGTNQSAYDINFGQYSSYARDMDVTAYNTPYLLSCWSAGNDRSDNPGNGNTVIINGSSVTYNSAVHPPGDGVYRGGYETIAYMNLAKNVLTVGAVNDAVNAGVRDPALATITSFSSTGPTDDGRIKPDVVANGASLKSTDIDSDNDYTTLSGTSMSSPNACGSAALLVDQYNRLFSSALRASTLKALLIHSADDRGNPGPDYFYGWGLINVKKAADIIASDHARSDARQIVEGRLTISTPSQTHSFTWDGISPIRATIAWTDPAGAYTEAHDSRTPTLVNNLNLKLVAPNGSEHFPFVMPFVGSWSIASMSQNATTGINNTDNVEQVLVANPGQAGQWQAVVSYSGSLTNGAQDYGLIISGLQPPDSEAPNPNPMTWATAPIAGNDPESEVTMTATTATDPSGVEYYFDETSGSPGGSDSGWQDSPVYTDSDLYPGTQYTYIVTARDKSPNQNITAPSAPASATTSGVPDTQPPSPSPMAFASFPVANGTTSIIMTATTAGDPAGVEYYFTETSGNPGGSDSGWQDSPDYEDTGLTPGTAYSYTVSARDKSPMRNTTAPSAVATTYTQPVFESYAFADSDIPVSGTVTGSYVNTEDSDDIYQQIMEVESSSFFASRRYSYLEHKWPFYVAAGDTVTFHVEAHHTANSEGDDFVFAYSTSGVDGPFSDMLTISKTADNNATQSFQLPAGTSGQVHVRVRDLDRTRGRRVLDSLYVDAMYFVSGSPGGGDTLPPTLVSIVDDRNGAPLECGTLVTYTVSFSEDMDGTSIDAADFGNAGSAPVVIGEVNEISPAVFTVEVTPTTPGTLQLQVNAGEELRDTSGNAMATDAPTADDIILAVIGVTYDSWIAGFDLDPADQAFDADPDGDGIPNAVEAWFGSHPAAINAGLANLASDGATITFTHPHNDSPPADIIAAYEWSPDMVAWYLSGNGPAAGPTVSMVPETTDGTTTVTATASEALPRIFLRVRVER